MKVLLFTAFCVGYCIKEYARISRLEKEFESFKEDADKEIAAIAARKIKDRVTFEKSIATDLEKLKAKSPTSSLR